MRSRISPNLPAWLAVSVGGSGRVVSDAGPSILEALEVRNVTLLVSPTNSVAEALAAMAGASVTVACAGATSSESWDRSSLRLDQHHFLEELAAAPRCSDWNDWNDCNGCNDCNRL